MFFELNFKSSELQRQTQVNIILPDLEYKKYAPYKTLWLFHGLAGNHTSWFRNTAIERYATAHRLAVVMPNVDRSWYTDTAYEANYFSFVTKELPELCFENFSLLSKKREDNIVGGLSMGGYGALKIALTYPERYGSCISLSGALDITRKGRPCNLNEWRSIFDFNMQAPTELEGSAHDIFALAKQISNKKELLPKLYMWCGTEDTLIDVNRAYDKHLTELDIPHKFETSEGDHSWKWWDLHIQGALEWILNG